ncbi:family 20 glycosylhydrolase [Flexithrix dorotheae]|uniref:family 20 glycosylhydrolase n=1 Tax=Flexithrix dorotheae TaxID=70993 RepID=UPI00036B3E8C|nr:family 20 glycosylhydrolase [Flexithrix dorotheae]
MKKSFFTVLILVLLHFSVSSQVHESLNLMPYPANATLQNGKFRIDKSFTVSFQNSKGQQKLYAATTRFLRRLDGRTGMFFKQGFLSENDNKQDASLVISAKQNGELKLFENESYKLTVTAQKISLEAGTDFGAMHGLETLLQLLAVDELGFYFPAIEIIDEPRFAWRGIMMDPARHFLPVEVIKRNLDAMSAVKMNVLHFHLCDNQGFRVESKVYPKLHELGSDGNYYTQQEIKDIVKYAGERGIRVMPEFDVPGHATAILVGYPELGSAPGPYVIERNAGIFDPTLDPTNEKTYEFLTNLFQEMAPLFPDEYFHIGGDENEGHDWDNNADIQKFMKEKGLKDNHELQGYFNNRLLEILTPLGKKMVGWDEILQPDLPKNAIIHSWRGKESLYEAAQKGYKAILSNGYYIDLMHPAWHHYLNDPLPEGNNLTEEVKDNILGGEATQWGELVTQLTVDSRIWPRSAAIAERFWSPANVKDVESMYKRMEVVGRQLEELGLKHITSREIIMRNLTRGNDTESLKNLIEVIEPLKVYTRNPGGTMYQSYSPFTLTADAANADAPAARKFNKLVNTFLYEPSKAEVEEIKKWLSLWANNHAALEKIIVKAPALKEMEEISANLSRIAKIGLEVMQPGFKPGIGQFDDHMEILQNARKQGGRTELQVVNAIEKLVKYHSAVLSANFTSQEIEIDGELTEWEDAKWYSYVPNDYYWKDKTEFALKWDEENLYIAFNVKNSNLQALKKKRDQEGLHMDDGVEFLIDANLDKSKSWEGDDIAYHINVLNAIIDDRGLDAKGQYNSKWNGKAKTAVKINGTINQATDIDKGYQVEVAIKWKEIGKTPANGLKLGINLCTNDRNDKTGDYRYYDFMNLKVFHVPSGFATLELVK